MWSGLQITYIITSSVDRTQHRVQRKERREGGGMGVALGKVPHLQIPRRRLHKKFREKEMYFLPLRCLLEKKPRQQVVMRVN